MKTVRALRGICIGPERHLAAEEVGQVDDATAHYLKSIGAVAIEPDAEPESTQEPAPAKAGKKEK